MKRANKCAIRLYTNMLCRHIFVTQQFYLIYKYLAYMTTFNVNVATAPTVMRYKLNIEHN